MKPLVSVIVAIYNVAPFLAECIESIIGQSEKNIEIILVDDGSKDESPEICDKYALKDSRIKVIHQTNSGVSVARNNGIEHSSADWIMMVDGDDWLTNDAIEKLYNLRDGNDIVIGIYYENYPNSEIFAGKSDEYNKVFSYDIKNNRNRILNYVLEEVDIPELDKIKCNLSSPWAKLYNKNYLNENNIRFVPGQVRAQDEVFNLYAFNFAEKIAIVNYPVYHYRLWENSICRKVTAKKVSLNIYEKWHDEVRKFIETFGYESEMNDAYNLFVMNLLTGVLKSYVNGYWDKNCTYREAISGIKEFANRDEFRNLIENYEINRFTSKKIKLMSKLWKNKSYNLLIAVCTVYRIKNKIKNYKSGMSTK
ncbi:MAG: glycosyltransferase family 2 protein [Oscillospiraceae bacterium]|nr:glycosyltransferase family 2 protein [Oscillospiraceae bacterium]